MVRNLPIRGMLVGIVAGPLSFGFLKVYGKPQVEHAIAFEAQMDIAKESGVCFARCVRLDRCIGATVVKALQSTIFPASSADTIRVRRPVAGKKF
jgi:hypothetical protein